jgi:hypothetical protein
MDQAVFQTLTDTLSADTNTRLAAELRLKELQVNPGICKRAVFLINKRSRHVQWTGIQAEGIIVKARKATGRKGRRNAALAITRFFIPRGNNIMNRTFISSMGQTLDTKIFITPTLTIDSHQNYLSLVMIRVPHQSCQTCPCSGMQHLTASFGSRSPQELCRYSVVREELAFHWTRASS